MGVISTAVPAKNASSDLLNLSPETGESAGGPVLAPIFGLGGQNAALVVSRFDDASPARVAFGTAA